MNHNEKHGMSSSQEYCAYVSAKYRCENPNKVSYKYYGGRGIRFLFTSFQQFYAELGPRPEGMSLDRIDTDGNYEPGNVQWATHSQQMRSRKRPHPPRQNVTFYRQPRSPFWWYSVHINGKRIRKSTGVSHTQVIPSELFRSLTAK